MFPCIAFFTSLKAWSKNLTTASDHMKEFAKINQMQRTTISFIISFVFNDSVFNMFK